MTITECLDFASGGEVGLIKVIGWHQSMITHVQFCSYREINHEEELNCSALVGHEKVCKRPSCLCWLKIHMYN